MVDAPHPGAVRLRLTAGGFWVRSRGAQPRFLAVEMLAQAAAVLLSGGDRGAPGYLAGVDEARGHGDVEAGDEIVAEVSLEARLGPLAKIRGSLSREGECLFSCYLVVRSG